MAGSKLKLQIWDTAGQQRFKTITQTYYRGAMGIILTYSIEDRNSFTDIENWVKQIKMHASSDVVKVLVGNKCDGKRKVTTEEGQKLALELDMEFFQTSAKENTNVSDMFLWIGSEAKSLLQHQKSETMSKSSEIVTTRNLMTFGGVKKATKNKCCGGSDRLA